MSDKFTINFAKASDHVTEVTIHLLDLKLVGEAVHLTINRKVLVKDSSPVNSEYEIFSEEIKLTQERVTLQVPTSKFQAFSYQGKMIDIEIHCTIQLNDGYVFDTKISQKVELEIAIKPKVLDSDSIVDPKDLFDFVKNFQSIPAKNQLFTIVLLFLACITIAINTLVGAHDQFVPESQTYFYSHTDSDGDSQSPLLNSLQGSGLIGVLIWLGIKTNLRKYMTLHFEHLPSIITPKDRIYAQQIIKGISRVDLENAIVRIVACNYEKGQYIRGSGTNRRTVNFSTPIQGVIIFEQRIPKLPANMEINLLLNHIIKFSKMFNTLYPFQMNYNTHGLDIHWELQLIHDEFIDQELIGPKIFKYSDFMTNDLPEEEDQKIADQLFKYV